MTKWKDLLVYNDKVAYTKHIGSLGDFLQSHPGHVNKYIELNDVGELDSFAYYFVAAPGEDPSWETPKGEVDWTGFADAVKAVKQRTKVQQESRTVSSFRTLVEKTLFESPVLDALTIASKNIRKELAEKFPKTKFSVTTRRFSMGNAIDVKWTDGPTTKQVNSVINKYSAGYFDGRDDSYTYRSDRSEELGYGKYVNANRSYSENAIQKGINAVAEKFHQTENIPTPQDYFSGQLTNRRGLGGFDWQLHLWQYIQETEF